MFVLAVASALSLLLVAASGSSNDYIDIWIISHSHDDTGWTRTVNEYYDEEVKWILTTSTDALLANPDRRFTYVEMAYFERWWNEIDDDRKTSVRKLIRDGRLQLNLAGWCMNDEGASMYSSDIDQMTVGALFARDELDTRPLVGWHIDPFGHSSVTPSLWADIGFNAFTLNRIDYRIKNAMKANKGLEFVWRASKSLGKSRDMWIHVLDSSYCSPNVITFDTSYIRDTMPTMKPNIGEIADSFIKLARERVTWYRHNQLLIPFGCDFAFQNAEVSFSQMDDLMAYMNSRKSYFNATLRYGTLEDYAKAVHALNLTWDVRDETDFFPYATAPDEYWTGYYTSRPQLKGDIRRGAALLRTAELIYSLASQSIDFDKEAAYHDVDVLRRAVAVSQHHDAVTGTETLRVADDYERRLARGNYTASLVIGELLGKMLSGDGMVAPSLSINSSVLASLKPGESVAVVVFNSLGWPRQSYVSIDVDRLDLIVTDTSGMPIPFDLVPGRDPLISSRLYFLARVPPLGFDTYFIQAKNSSNATKVRPCENQRCKIENQYYAVTFSDETGLLSSIYDKSNDNLLRITQTLVEYESASLDGEQTSGAYIFRPAHDNRTVFYPQGPTNVQTSVDFFTKRRVSMILATALTQNDAVVYRVAIAGQSSSGFSVLAEATYNALARSSIYFADYWSIDSNNLPSGAVTGSIRMNFSRTTNNRTCTTTNIHFNQPFASTPRLFSTVRVARNPDDSFVASRFVAHPFLVTPSGAAFNVCYTGFSGENVGNRHTDSVFIDWLALASNLNFSESSVVHGNHTILGGSTDDLLVVRIPLEQPYLRYDPGIVLQVTGGTRVYFANVIKERSTKRHFSISIVNWDLRPWNETITVNYLLFPRYEIEYDLGKSAPAVHTFAGKYVSEVRQTFGPNHMQIFRLYNGLEEGDASGLQYIDHEFVVGPLHKGRELVTRYESNLKTKGTWYTDDNGLEMKKRDYKEYQTEPIAGNYYPMIAGSYVEDALKDERLTFLSERSHGCSSLTEGMLEIMLHRRCLSDDGKGVDQVLNDIDRINPKLWIVYADKEDSAYRHRHLSLQQQFPLTPVFSPVIDPKNWTKSYRSDFSGLNESLPPNVHLLSLRARSALENGTILRLQHIFEVNESRKYSEPAFVALSSLFAPEFVLSNSVEMALTSTASKAEAVEERLKWNTVSKPEDDSNARWSSKEKDDDLMMLSPREIRTFLVNSPKKD